jgi:hypothetical protein
MDETNLLSLIRLWLNTNCQITMKFITVSFCKKNLHLNRLIEEWTKARQLQEEKVTRWEGGTACWDQRTEHSRVEKREPPKWNHLLESQRWTSLCPILPMPLVMDAGMRHSLGLCAASSFACWLNYKINCIWVD